MSISMLADQSSYSRTGLPMPDGATPSVSFALQGDFLGLVFPEEESHWGLSPISLSLPSWNGKNESAFTNFNPERDLKNSRLRNGQPTPPPYDDNRSSQDIYPPLPQYSLGASPATFPDHNQHRSYSEHSGFEGHSYSGGSNTDNSHSAAKRRKSSKETPIDFDDSPHLNRTKREKFLERNRLAASKCRQKKKEHTQQLESRYREESDKKEQLVAEIARMRSETLGLKNEVFRHAQCGNEPIKIHLAQMVKNITYNDTTVTATESCDAADVSWADPVTRAT